MEKTQILIIHGGSTFKNRKDYLRHLRTKKISPKKQISWAGDYLEDELGKKFEIIRPRMPQPDNARYKDWKIFFERHLPYLKNRFILVGASLGGIFLAKYLSENKLQKKALSSYLICPPFDNTLSGEDLVGGFKLISDLSLIEKNSKIIRLLFSKDDDIVPIAHAEKYRQKLKNAKIAIYKRKKGHFKISKFPEIIKMIKNDARMM